MELGRALREAYESMDADGIHELSQRRRSVVSALSRQAAELAQEAGHRLSDTTQQDVESTLRAVLADQDAADQWATGRLQSSLTPPSTFPSPTTPAASSSAKPSPSKASRLASRTQAKAERADRGRQRHEELAQAKKAAEAAQQRLRDQRAKHAQAGEILQRARTRHDQARQQASALEQQLQRAQAQLQRAEHEHQKAQARHQATADALAETEQSARKAAQRVEHLTAATK